MKQILKIFALILIFIILYFEVNLLLIRKGNTYGTDVYNFYKQDNNSIDILYLGSSHTYTSFDPYLIEELTNLSGYDFATQQQPIWITYHYLIEALITQNPKYIIMDILMVTNDLDYVEESINRDAIDKMHFSKNKVDVIKTSVKNKEDRTSYYLNIIKYHSRFKELTKHDIKYLLGYTIDNKGYKGLDENNYIWINNNSKTLDIKKISKKNEIYLKKIIDLAKEKNITLILVKTPSEESTIARAQYNYVKELSFSSDVLYYNFNDYFKEMNISNKDFYDQGHLNINGSKKFSSYFASTLMNFK